MEHNHANHEVKHIWNNRWWLSDLYYQNLSPAIERQGQATKWLQVSQNSWQPTTCIIKLIPGGSRWTTLTYIPGSAAFVMGTISTPNVYKIVLGKYKWNCYLYAFDYSPWLYRPYLEDSISIYSGWPAYVIPLIHNIYPKILHMSRRGTYTSDGN